jgi:hypothetical protein
VTRGIEIVGSCGDDSLVDGDNDSGVKIPGGVFVCVVPSRGLEIVGELKGTPLDASAVLLEVVITGCFV